nr:PREDICTED: adipogenesis regulatory factor [Equus przewalskii]
MASKGLQDLKQQVEGAAQEAVTAAGAAVQQVVDQATEAGQKDKGQRFLLSSFLFFVAGCLISTL